MNSRLLYIALAQVVALVLWILYAQYLLNSLEGARREEGVRGFNLGVTAMALQTSMAGVVGTDQQNRKLFEEHHKLQMKNQDGSDFDDFTAICFLAIPAGLLGVLVIVALLFEMQFQKRIASGIAAKRIAGNEQVDF